MSLILVSVQLPSHFEVSNFRKCVVINKTKVAPCMPQTRRMIGVIGFGYVWRVASAQWSLRKEQTVVIFKLAMIYP